MSGPYINNGNYVYGVAQYTQPGLPCYDTISKHKVTRFRSDAASAIRDDGVPYTSYTEDTINYCATCGRCNRIKRASMVTNIVNIESSITKVLTIKLYANNPDDDKTISMKVGNKYCISYITESGMQTVTGVLGEISTNIPDECTTYIGNYSTVSTAAYIGLDCSTVGQSDKRLIYIAAIRYIEEVWDDDEDKYASLSQAERIQLMVNDLSSSIKAINNYVSAKMEYLESLPEVTEQEDPKNSYKRGPVPPPPGGWRGGPLIIGPRPPVYPPYSPACPDQNKGSSGSGNNSVNSDDDIDYEALIDALKDVKSVMNSFIAAYELERNPDDDCNCPCKDVDPPEKPGCGCCDPEKESATTPKYDIGTPIVPEVPYNARERDLFLVPIDDEEDIIPLGPDDPDPEDPGVDDDI